MTKIRFDPASIHMTPSLNSFGKLFAHAQRGKLKQTKSNRGRKRCLTDSARKRNRATVASKWNKSRVYIGNQFERWNELKAILNVDTHAEVANVLLNK